MGGNTQITFKEYSWFTGPVPCSPWIRRSLSIYILIAYWAYNLEPMPQFDREWRQLALDKRDECTCWKGCAWSSLLWSHRLNERPLRKWLRQVWPAKVLILRSCRQWSFLIGRIRDVNELNSRLRWWLFDELDLENSRDNIDCECDFDHRSRTVSYFNPSYLSSQLDL